MASKVLTVRVESAHGHGVHGLLPGEGCLCRVSLPGARPPEVFTHAAQPSKLPHVKVHWGQEFSLALPERSDLNELAVTLYGRRTSLEKPLGPHSDDVVGQGSCGLAALLEGGTQQVALVPLRSGAGKEAAVVELLLRMHAAPTP